MNEAERKETINLLVTARESVNDAMRNINAHQPQPPKGAASFEEAYVWLRDEADLDNWTSEDIWTKFSDKFIRQWQPPVLKEFTKEDWWGYAGCEDETPMITQLSFYKDIYGNHYDFIVESKMVGLYGFKEGEDGPEQTFTWIRDFSKNDEFFNEVEARAGVTPSHVEAVTV